MVVLRKVVLPRAIFVVIPLVIILVVFIVNSVLIVSLLRHRDSHNCDWPREGSGQEKRCKVTIRKVHV
jgi:hypothetical protein